LKSPSSTNQQNAGIFGGIKNFLGISPAQQSNQQNRQK